MTLKLPDAQSLAALVSDVTEQWCGATFAPEDPLMRGESVCAKMYLLALEGEPRISVVVGCDRRASRALARAIFKCEDSAIENEVADDAVRELLNMVGSRIRNTLAPDRMMGVPRITNLVEIVESGGLTLNDTVLIRSQGSFDFRIWLFEQSTPSQALTTGSKLRSLLGKRGG